MAKNLPITTVHLEKIVGGGQTLTTMDDGRKLFVWGGLPTETVQVQLTKKKSSYAEGVVTEVISASPDRISPRDPDSYLSTSPWQIMKFEAEQKYKAELIAEAFQLHHTSLPDSIQIYSDGTIYNYRNKIEFSFWFDTEKNTLSFAFFRRGTHGKIPIEKTSLASTAITKSSQEVLDALNNFGVQGRALKTLLIRSDQQGNTAWQLYVKDATFPVADFLNQSTFSAISTEIIYSDPRSPASVITQRLTANSQVTLHDSICNRVFSYPTESFFQINLPVYQAALLDMERYIENNAEVVDLYSGVGTIGLTIGGDNVTLVEVNESAVNEMQRTIKANGLRATPIASASEKALEYIKPHATIIVDPPRAGLHRDVITCLLEISPPRIIYLSCNPVTQARDIALLSQKYQIVAHKGYNFFPRTPHIEHLVVLDVRK